MKLPKGVSRLDLVRQGLTGNLPRRGRFVVSITRLMEDPQNERRTFRNMEGLIESVKLHGIVEPITVTPEGEGYRILTGHRRYRAAKAAGLSEIEVLVRDPEDDYSRRLKSLISNIQREAISPVEVAETLQRLLEEGEGIRSQRDLARLLGMRDAWVSDILRILTLPAKLQERLRTAERAVPYDTVMRVAHAGDPAFQAELIEAILAGEGSQVIRQRIAERKPASPKSGTRRRAMQTFTESRDGYTATVKGPDTDGARDKMRAVVRALLDYLN
jgi:ParB/RepB/Spo0J family partition protein